MKVGEYRKPKRLNRPPTELEKQLAYYYEVWHPFDSVEGIIDDFNQTFDGEDAKIVDVVDNILIAWFPERDKAVQLYYIRRRHNFYDDYRIAYVVECPDEYEEE